VDDTTKEIYGHHSTKYFLQEDLFRGNKEQRTLDTSLNHLHYYNYQYTNNTWYQGLGNLGMAMKPIFYKAPTEIGYKLGFEAFHPYLNSEKAHKYYDTKSPYTELHYLQGSTGEQRIFILFTANVNRYWNIGGSYNRFTSSKQYNVIQSRDFQTDHNQVNIFSSVKSNKDKYTALLDFNYMQHWSYESGGVKTADYPGVIDSGMFIYKYAKVNLDKNKQGSPSSPNGVAARNYYKTLSAHLFHQFNLLDSGNTLLHVYHEFDWLQETQYFRDNNMKIDSSYRLFYKETHYSDSLSFYQYNYDLIQNKLGLKGHSDHFYYSLFYKFRNYSLLDKSQDSATIGKSRIRFQDAFAGGSLGFQLSPQISVNLSGQGMTSFSMNQHPDNKYYTSHHDYQWAASANYKKWQVELGQSRVSPSLMQTRMVTNLASWARDKDSMNAVTNTNAVLSYSHVNGDRFLQASLSYQRIDHLVYFTKDTVKGSSYQKIRPIQDSGYMDYIQPSLSFRTNWRWLYLENDLILTHLLNGRDIIHMPTWYTFPKLYYQNNLFKKATLLQAGVEVLLKASYYADFYAPQINQFYLQNTFSVPTFPITNVFINLKIRQVRVFIRATNLWGDMNYQTGYFDTPYYPGMRRSFQFGVIWKAFD
jgi:hypothetical protein